MYISLLLNSPWNKLQHLNPPLHTHTQSVNKLSKTMGIYSHYFFRRVMIMPSFKSHPLTSQMIVWWCYFSRMCQDAMFTDFLIVKQYTFTWQSQLFKFIKIDFTPLKKIAPDLAKEDISPPHSKNHLKYKFNFEKPICNLPNTLLHDC